MKKKNYYAFTVVEILIGFVVGTIMLIALYSSYDIFTKSYVSIIDKINVNKALRISMATIVKDIRSAGYVDINSVNYGKTFTPLTFRNGGNGSPDQIDIIYEKDKIFKENLDKKKKLYESKITKEITFIKKNEHIHIRFIMRILWNNFTRSNGK